MASLSYRDAGVDIDEGNRLVDDIKPLIAKTQRPEVIGGLGGFGGLFAVPQGYREPVLVSGTDGIGTKLRLGIDSDRLDGLGQDLVAMCVNDVLVAGAEPLFFLDYFATGKLERQVARARDCRRGRGLRPGRLRADWRRDGRNAGVVPAGRFSTPPAFAWGIAERAALLDGSQVAAGGRGAGPGLVRPAQQRLFR